MLRRLSIIAATVLPALFIAGTSANAAPAPRMTSPRVDFGGANDWCNPTGFQLCLRDPSDGGAGTTVVASFHSDSNAEDWKLISDTGRCAGGTVTSSCPGGWVSSNFRGFPILVLKNVGQGTLCIRTAATTNFVAKMGTCDSGNEISSAFVWAQFGNGTFGFDSVDASNVFSQQEWLTGASANDSTVSDNPGGVTAFGEWLPTGS